MKKKQNPFPLNFSLLHCCDKAYDFVNNDHGGFFINKIEVDITIEGHDETERKYCDDSKPDEPAHIELEANVKMYLLPENENGKRQEISHCPYCGANLKKLLVF